MIRRLLIHFLAPFRRRRRAPGYDLPEISSPFAEIERYFVASHRMAGARMDYSEQSIAYVEQIAHKLLQHHPTHDDDDESSLTEEEWRQEADRFITMGGSYLGSVIIMRLGGKWSGNIDERDDMAIEAIGGTEVRARPFEVVADRILSDGESLWKWYRSLRTEVERGRRTEPRP